MEEDRTNVTRHAGCTVTITCDQAPTIDVRDDSGNPDPYSTGVGLTSTRECATALGGAWMAGPTPTGRIF